MEHYTEYDATREFLASEAFIRRASQLGLPVMLKGSFLTRQYFADPTARRPQDMDWLYLERFESGQEAVAALNQWVIRATELPMNDGFAFTSFRADAFWRRIDYAMADDFPTVNTDLEYALDGLLDELNLDVSFNLPMDVPSVPLLYRPAQGEPFVVEHTAPLALQVAWKLHQSLVRTRFKDLVDLLHLVRHPDFTAAVREQALTALRQECRADNADLGRLRYLLAGTLELLFTATNSGDWPWTSFRARLQTNDLFVASQLPLTLADLEHQLRAAFALAGFDAAQLPEPGASARRPEQVPAAKRAYLQSLRDLLGG